MTDKSKGNETGMRRLLFDCHMHTPLCKHTTGAPGEYAQVADERGLKGVIFTCHNPMPHGYSVHTRMASEELDTYFRMIYEARAEWEGRVEVYAGIEADFFPGYEAWVERQLASADFHYVLGSVHPQIREFKSAFWRGDPVAYQRMYFDMLADAAESGLFDCLSHPDLVKKVTADDWDLSLIMDDVRRSLDRIALTSTAMELNTSGARHSIGNASVSGNARRNEPSEHPRRDRVGRPQTGARRGRVH